MRALVTPLLLGLLVGCGSNPGGIPDFSLEDVNATSPTFGQELGPADFEGEVSAWYFGWADCPICQSHMRSLDALSSDLGPTDVPVTILGINDPGRISGNDAMTDGLDLAWLQDTPEDDVFGAWPPAEIRELKIIGPDGQLHASLNLNVDDPGTEDGGTKVTEALQAAAAVPVSDGAE